MDFTSILGYPLGWVMWAFFWLVKNYGVAVLLFTLFVRLIMFPLGVKQQKSSAKMASIQPKITAIQNKYKNNRQKMQEEQMKLYEEEGYSPTAGCLPLVLQMLVLFGLINVIYNPLTHILHLPADAIAQAVELVKGGTISGLTVNAAAPQLGVISAIQDPQFVGYFEALGQDFISAVQGLNLNFLGLDLGAIPTFDWNILVIVPILSGVTALATSLLSMKFSYMNHMSQGQGTNGMTKGMMYIMPIFSLVFAFQVPVGVVIYWILSNIFSAVQTVVLFKVYTPEKMEKMLEDEKKKKKKSKKQSVYQKALENAKASGQMDKAPDFVEDENGMISYHGEMITKKEANRRRLAEARRRDAEKYGEEYKEVTDDDLR